MVKVPRAKALFLDANPQSGLSALRFMRFLDSKLSFVRDPDF